MKKIPILSPVKMEKLLLKIGFIMVREKGSHRLYKHLDGRVTTIPFHKGRDLSRVLIYEILKEIKISKKDFLKIIEKI